MAYPFFSFQKSDGVESDIDTPVPKVQSLFAHESLENSEGKPLKLERYQIIFMPRKMNTLRLIEIYSVKPYLHNIKVIFIWIDFSYSLWGLDEDNGIPLYCHAQNVHLTHASDKL